MINKLRYVNGMIATFLLLPIWLYLLHFLLEASGASDLQWFLFYAYVPLHLFVAFVTKIVEKE